MMYVSCVAGREEREREELAVPRFIPCVRGPFVPLHWVSDKLLLVPENQQGGKGQRR